MKRYVMTKVNSGRHFEHFTLKLLNVQRQDSGKYFCQADNGHGATTGDMDVRVRSKQLPLYFVSLFFNIEMHLIMAA